MVKKKTEASQLIQEEKAESGNVSAIDFFVEM